MKFEEIINDLRNKVYHPVYFLMGEEPYYIDKITDYITGNVLADHEKEFNQTILYGKDTDVLTVVSEAKRFPMMGNHQVLIVKEAQDMKKIEEMGRYLENPVKSTILVICYKYKRLTKQNKLINMISKNGVLFESKKLRDYQMHDWLTKYIKSNGYNAGHKSLLMLTEYLGTDLGKIANEISKIIINVPKGAEIKPEHIEEYIGISKDFNNFELQNALGTKNVFKANRIINYFAANPKNNPMQVTMVVLYSYFSKLLGYYYLKDKSRNNVASVLKINPYFVKDYQQATRQYSAKKLVSIISVLHEYDLKSKKLNNASAEDGELLKEMVFKILN